MASQPQRAQSNERPPIAGEAFLRALADHGIDYFFANPGTDFAPVVEDVKISTIFYGVIPFIITDLIRLVILIAFPIIALWLPSHM